MTIFVTSQALNDYDDCQPKVDCRASHVVCDELYLMRLGFSHQRFVRYVDICLSFSPCGFILPEIDNLS